METPCHYASTLRLYLLSQQFGNKLSEFLRELGLPEGDIDINSRELNNFRLSAAFQKLYYRNEIHFVGSIISALHVCKLSYIATAFINYL